MSNGQQIAPADTPAISPSFLTVPKSRSYRDAQLARVVPQWMIVWLVREARAVIAFVMMGILAVLGFLCISEAIPAMARPYSTPAVSPSKPKENRRVATKPEAKLSTNSKLDIVVPPSYRPFPAAPPKLLGGVRFPETEAVVWV